MSPTDYVEFNDLTAEADTKWFKLWSTAMKPKFSKQQDLFWETGKDKHIGIIGNLFLESLQVHLKIEALMIVTKNSGMQKRGPIPLDGP